VSTHSYCRISPMLLHDLRWRLFPRYGAPVPHVCNSYFETLCRGEFAFFPIGVRLATTRLWGFSRAIPSPHRGHSQSIETGPILVLLGLLPRSFPVMFSTFRVLSCLILVLATHPWCKLCTPLEGLVTPRCSTYAAFLSKWWYRSCCLTGSIAVIPQSPGS